MLTDDIMILLPLIVCCLIAKAGETGLKPYIGEADPAYKLFAGLAYKALLVLLQAFAAPATSFCRSCYKP